MKKEEDYIQKAVEEGQYGRIITYLTEHPAIEVNEKTKAYIKRALEKSLPRLIEKKRFRALIRWIPEIMDKYEIDVLEGPKINLKGIGETGESIEESTKENKRVEMTTYSQEKLRDIGLFLADAHIEELERRGGCKGLRDLVDIVKEEVHREVTQKAWNAILSYIVKAVEESEGQEKIEFSNEMDYVFKQLFGENRRLVVEMLKGARRPISYPSLSNEKKDIFAPLNYVSARKEEFAAAIKERLINTGDKGWPLLPSKDSINTKVLKSHLVVLRGFLQSWDGEYSEEKNLFYTYLKANLRHVLRKELKRQEHIEELPSWFRQLSSQRADVVYVKDTFDELFFEVVGEILADDKAYLKAHWAVVEAFLKSYFKEDQLKWVKALMLRMSERLNEMKQANENAEQSGSDLL